jgi:hypothetical protein
LLFELRTYLRIVRLALREEKSRRRRRVVVVALVAIPVLAALNAVCFALDPLFFPGFRRVEVRAPVFIVGHARSGTSLMHRLMACDEERFSWFATWELFLPSLLQRKLVRLLGACDRRFLGGRIARGITDWEDRAFARGRGMHPMSLTGPEEDEFLMALSCASGTVTTFFPYLRELEYLYFTDQRPVRQRRRVLSFYRACVRRQLYQNGPEKTHLSKNPVFSGKMESLIEAFPDARFIVLERSPLETIPSLLKMMERNWRASDCARPWIDDSLEVLARQSIHTYTQPLEVLARHPEIRSTIVDYRDLVTSPARAVEAAYAALDMTVSPALAAQLEREEARHADHRTEHVYDLAEFGLSRAEIRSQLAPLFARFGWDVASETGETRTGAST